jgi:putative colanic acid biosynthesis UDP-glucose lipid carrier transferase
VSLLSIEFVLLNVILIIYLSALLPHVPIGDISFLQQMAGITILYNISWLVIILYVREKEFYTNSDYGYFRSLFMSLFIFVGFISILVSLLNISDFELSTFLVPIFIFSILNLISNKYLLKYLKSSSSNHFSNTLLIGHGDDMLNLKEFSKVLAGYGHKVVGFLKDRDQPDTNAMTLGVFGNIDDLEAVITANSIDEIFIETSSLDEKQIQKSIQIADNFGVRVKLILGKPLHTVSNYKTDTLGDLVVFNLRQSSLDNFNNIILKRLFDFCFALVVVVVFSPIFLLIGLLIYLDNKGSILYTPLRKGEAGETFKCYKFRTMNVCDDIVNGTKSTAVNDPRITRLGKILRKTDLDEMPQFFNVLIGNMSVVGPRPHRINLQNDLRKCVNDYMIRSYIKPGITGWAQVNGWRGPTETDQQKNERIRHDLWYIENWDFWLDLKIILMTLFGKHYRKAVKAT